MNKHVLPNPPARLLTAFSAVALGGFILVGCVTDDQYARQLCLDKGVAENSGGYSDCITAQHAWIEADRRENVRFRPNS